MRNGVCQTATTIHIQNYTELKKELKNLSFFF